MIDTFKPILHLVLNTKWFKMVLSGEKTVDYREIKTYYGKLFACGKIKIGGIFYEADQVVICFRLGNRKNNPSMLVACQGLSIGVGNPNWGASPNVPYYRLDLGKILAVVDCGM